MGIIIIASGGQGGSYLNRRLGAHKRPDIAFYPRRGIYCINIKSTDKPTERQREEFLGRTHGWYTLNLDRTIEENMINYLEHINADGTKNTVLAGSLSLMGPFFRKNKIENAFCLIRHPVHIMVALLTIRHAKHAKRYGGINTKACVEDYASLWNSIAKDAIEGSVGILRHEYIIQDMKGIEDVKIKEVLGGLYSKERFHGILKPEYEEQLKELVSDNYFKIYDRWNI